MAKKKPDIKSLYYITHIDNLPSILTNGIFSHQQILERGIQFTKIYDSDSFCNRKEKYTPIGKSLWEYANVYFQARNPIEKLLWMKNYLKNQCQVC